MKKYHFISGLPRSGTTLLSTILKQNPRFEASISGPLARFTRSIITESSSQGGYRFECPPEKNKKLINGLFENYYDDTSKEVAFNTNRGWGGLLPVVKDLYPDSKIIMCVRDIGWILDSFESLQVRNPYVTSTIFAPADNISVYSRTEALLNQNSTLGFAYNALKQAMSSEFKSSIFLIEYDVLAKQPESVMRNLYKFIGEPYFEHNFNDVESSYDEFDNDVQLPGLHTTRKVVEYKSRPTILPPDIWQRVKGMEFWKNS